MIVNFLKEVDNYLNLRRKLGYKLLNAAGMLRKFAMFLTSSNSPCITVQLTLQFATKNSNSSSQQWARRLSMIRQFARYLSATHPGRSLLLNCFHVTLAVVNHTSILQMISSGFWRHL